VEVAEAAQVVVLVEVRRVDLQLEGGGCGCGRNKIEKYIKLSHM